LDPAAIEQDLERMWILLIFFSGLLGTIGTLPAIVMLLEMQD
jgi:hypothetical protein